MQAGVAFLLERQEDDGLWRDFNTLAGTSADWVTGYVGLNLHLAGAPRAPLERAARALLERQRPDGGWGYHEGVPTDADSTAYASLYLAAGRWWPPGAARRARRCLERHQREPDGGIATYAEEGPIREYMDLSVDFSIRGWCRSHAEVSAAAGLALVALDADGRPAARAAWRFLQGRQHPAGRWDSYWWTLPHYPTAMAVAFACALPKAIGSLSAVERAVRWVAEGQRADGAWPVASGLPDAFATSLGVSILALGRGPGADIERGMEALLRLGDDDGGWPSRPVLRIPPPSVEEPANVERWRIEELGTGVVVADQKRLYTTATAVGALARAGG